MTEEQTSQTIRVKNTEIALKAFWTKEKTPQLVGFHINVKMKVVHIFPPPFDKGVPLETYTHEIVPIMSEDLRPLIDTLQRLDSDKLSQEKLKKRMN